MPAKSNSQPRIGVPWCATAQEAAAERKKYDFYLHAVEAAGGEAVEISLQSGREFSRDRAAEWAAALDGFLLTGSPADVDPAWYHSPRHPHTADPDPQREQTDFALLDVAFRDCKPVLAICYGSQSLNVYLGGNLFQHIPDEISQAIEHTRQHDYNVFHPIAIESGTRLAQIAGARDATVNTSHHQSVLRPGRELRIAARAPDGVVEAIEYAGSDNWVLGVQWHPEVMTGDPFAQALFRELITAARRRLA